ncbi:hypothetical protein LWC33_22170 [Pseudonocardia sp. RS11V-5]|uniref:hypothetical protein n=1 Tax=Pseudonocardia terrae TaxID=2905831 RepID=UPI001E42BB34|nr:hypothetical protein [Pseudonocardia terrae]MCE3554145.1 hypothetical protein [Pseudonocardia terrae]
MTAPATTAPATAVDDPEILVAGYPRRFQILNLVDRDLAIVAYESGEWESRPAVGAVLHTDQAWNFEVGHRFGHENKADLCVEIPAGAGHPHVDIEFDVDAFGTPWASASATPGISATVSGSTVIVTAGSGR